MHFRHRLSHRQADAADMAPQPYLNAEEKKDDFSSTEPPSPPSTHTQFASISIHRNDRLRILAFPAAVVAGIKNVIGTSWPRGIQAEKTYPSALEFKLAGNPWASQGSDAVPSRCLMRDMLAYLYAQGWLLHASTDVSTKPVDKDTLVFRWQSPPSAPSEWLCVSFNRSDRLRLIGGDSELIGEVRHLLRGMNMVQSESWKEVQRNAYEFKCRGYPWMVTGDDTMTTRLFLLRLLAVLEAQGWSLYASIDQNSSTSESESEADAWYCVRSSLWQPGMPVTHR